MNLYRFRKSFIALGVMLALNAMLGTSVFATQQIFAADETSLSKLPSEMLLLTYEYLPEKDLDNLKVVSKDLYVSCSGYRERLISLMLMNQINNLPPTMSDLEISRALSVLGKITQKRNGLFLDMLDEKMKKESFLFVSMGSPLAPYLHKRFMKLITGNLLQNLDIAGTIYEEFFQHSLPNEDLDGTILALNHLQAAWHIQGVYSSYSSKRESIKKFLLQYAEKLRKFFPQQPCFPFGFIANTIKQARYIVITDMQLKSQDSRDSLEETLKENPHLTVILSVGDTVNNGKLILSEYAIPSSLKRLRLVNPKGNVTSVDDGFLDCFKRLEPEERKKIEFFIENLPLIEGEKEEATKV